MNTKFIACVAAVALLTTACTRPDRFDPDAAGSGAGASGGAEAANNPASDPTSPVYFSQTIGDRVLFEIDQSTLSPAAMATLDGQAQWLLANADYLAIIEGHADEQGTREYNLALGNRRANAVREYLVSKGVPATRMRTISYGKERPIEVCSEEACYAKNRRAVTVINIAALS